MHDLRSWLQEVERWEISNEFKERIPISKSESSRS